jgi:hypothetical protein
MHSATDRDNYVTINWQNIQPGNVSTRTHNILNMHQFPVHTEHTNISHSLHTTVTVMYSSNGCSKNVQVLQKIFWTQFGRAFTIIWIASIKFNLFNSHSTNKTESTQHTSTYFPCRNVPCNNNDISYTGHITSHHITQYIHNTLRNIFPYMATKWTYLIFRQYIAIYLCRHHYCISIKFINITV